VFAILLCAPLGVVLIHFFAPRLLEKGVAPQRSGTLARTSGGSADGRSAHGARRTSGVAPGAAAAEDEVEASGGSVVKGHLPSIGLRPLQRLSRLGMLQPLAITHLAVGAGGIGHSRLMTTYTPSLAAEGSYVELSGGSPTGMSASGSYGALQTLAAARSATGASEGGDSVAGLARVSHIRLLRGSTLAQPSHDPEISAELADAAATVVSSPAGGPGAPVGAHRVELSATAAAAWQPPTPAALPDAAAADDGDDTAAAAEQALLEECDPQLGAQLADLEALFGLVLLAPAAGAGEEGAGAGAAAAAAASPLLAQQLALALAQHRRALLERLAPPPAAPADPESARRFFQMTEGGRGDEGGAGADAGADAGGEVELQQVSVTVSDRR